MPVPDEVLGVDQLLPQPPGYTGVSPRGEKKGGQQRIEDDPGVHLE